ncbi:hypothetical protein LU11_gp383 [Pseudomonas phage Lu11]|uniref:hypothetical protein n=1 Tax=Pseudomonas phage Lu11 TaxID=1161927 RepID=UPI00025F18DC|nr:hypothetical protein LU11_gp383 [Pseudomonas phage Lu11]AFH14914.1 hypothetical protein Lu11_0376 [Pseudomonas phage Lu11]
MDNKVNTAEKQFTAFYNTVTESEAGWGSRFDGYLIALTEEAFNARAEKIKAAGSYQEFSYVDGPPKVCIITEEMHKQLVEHGTVWTNDKSWLLK